ncbi:MAG: hypothetical protein SFY67_12685 [Candidatus Melainabacteria bacterium]|nr:hypothetical protein [Candidatus Melainabacteria bacterium]
MGTPIGFVLGVFVMGADQPENKPAQPEVAEGTGETKVEAPSAAHTEAYDRSSPALTTVAKPGELSQEVKNILGRFAIIGDDASQAGSDARSIWNLGLAEQHRGFGAFGSAMHDVTRTEDGKYIGRDGKPLSTGEMNVTFRHLVQGALKANPSESPDKIVEALNANMKGSGFEARYDADKGTYSLVDTQAKNADGTPRERELSRYKSNENPQEHAERMADRFSDMPREQQEAFIKRGISTMLKGMTDIPGGQTANQQREDFIKNFNAQLRASGNTDQTLEFDPKNGAVIKSDTPGRAIEGAASPEVPEGLRLQGKQNLENQYRNLSNFIQNAENNGKTVGDIQAELKKVTGASTGDLDNMAAGLNLDVKEQYGPEFGVRRNDKNQLEMTVRVSDTPPVDMPIPTGMNAEQARNWAKTVKAIQTEAANPGGLKTAMEGDLGRQLHEQLSSQSPEVRKEMLESINRSLPENDHKLGLNPTDNQSIDLIARDGKREAQFRSPEVEAARTEIWNRRPEGLSEQNRDAYIDSVMKFTTGGPEGKTDAFRALRETVRSLPPDQQGPFLKGVNDELRAAGKDYRITNTDGRIEARTTVVARGQDGNDVDITVPRYLEGNPAKVEAFKQIAQGILDGKDLTQLTKGINDATADLGFYGKQEVTNSLNALLPDSVKQNLRFEQGRSGAIELQTNIGNDLQGNPVWSSVPEGMTLAEASQIGKTIPAGLDATESRNYQHLLESLGQNPNEIFKKENMDQIRKDLAKLDPTQAALYRDQINAQLGDKFQLGQNGDVRTKPGDVPVPEGLNPKEAEAFRGLAERAITDVKGSELGNDILKALSSVRPELKQAFLDGINNAYGPKHNSENFSMSGDNLNLNKWKFGLDPFTNPVLDTFKPDSDQSRFENTLRDNGFENPGANPNLEAIRKSFDTLSAAPTDAEALKQLAIQMRTGNFTEAQIQALQKTFNEGRQPDSQVDLTKSKDGIVKLGDNNVISTTDGTMVVKGNLSDDSLNNLKYAMARIGLYQGARGSSDLLSSVLANTSDEATRESVINAVNDFLKAKGSTDSVAPHPGGGIYLTTRDGGVEKTSWIKSNNVEASPSERATDALNRLVQNPTDAKAMVADLERNPQALTQEIENLLEKPPYSDEVQAKLKALYENGNTDTRTTIERSIAVTGDMTVATAVGLTGNALKVVDFSNRIMNGEMDNVGTDLANFLNGLTPGARASVLADLKWAVQSKNGSDASIAFNSQNELVFSKDGKPVDGYPAGEMGQVLDAIRAKGIADPYVLNNLGHIRDAFTQIKANDPAGLKSFLEQLSAAKLDPATQAKLVAGLNERFHTNVSMNEQGVLTDGTNSYRLAEVNGKAMAVPAGLSAELVAKLGNTAELKKEIAAIAASGNLAQLQLLMQTGDFSSVVAEALQESQLTNTAQIAGDLHLSSDAVTAAQAHDQKLAFQNEIKALMPAGTAPDVVARFTAQFDKFKAALAAGNGPVALAEFAAATKGNLSSALIDKLNTQLSGYRLASGTGTLALAKIGGESGDTYIASIDTLEPTKSDGGLIAAYAAEGTPKLDTYTAGDVYRVGQLQSEVNPPILEMPKTPALPERVMSQLYTLALETRLELQVALQGKTDPAERARIVQDILVKKGLDVMQHATTSENGMTFEQRQAFVESMNRFLLSAASIDNFAPALKDFRFKLSGDNTNPSLTLEGDGKSIPLTKAESNDRLYEQRLGSDLGLDVTQHAELKTSLRALREATTPEARETAYKALLAKMTSLNLTPDQMKIMVDTLQDPKFKFIEGTGTISYDGPPPINLKHFKASTGDFYVPGDLTKTQFDTLRGYIIGFADNRNNFVSKVDTFRLFLGQLTPQQREIVVKQTEYALNFRRWGLQSETKLSIQGNNLIVDGGLTDKREWAITTDAAAPRRTEAEQVEINGKQYDLPPNLTDAQKEQLKGVITELGKPPAGTITQAVRDQLAALLKDVPIGTARTEMLRTINAASTELQKTTFTLEGNKLSIVTDGKPVTPPIEIPAPTAGPADLATAMKELQTLINCNLNPDVGLMRKAISDVARLYAKEKGSNFNPAELAKLLNGAGMENFKFTVDTTSQPGQTEIVVTDKAGKEINRINTRDIMGDATVAAGPVNPAAISERTDIPDLSAVPEAQRPLVEAIFKANDVQSMLKAISDARKAGLTQFKIGNDVYRIEVKGLGSNTSLVHMTINGKIAVKAVDRNGVFHPQSDGKYFGSSYIGSNPDSPIATRARDLKLTTPQEVSLALKAGALTPGRTSSDAPLSPQQVQDRLKELGVTIPDATNAQTAFKQIQDLQNAITSSKPADIKRALDVLKANGDVAPQLEGLIAKINASPANALKIEGGAIKLQIGDQKYDIPPAWDANTIRNLVRLSTTDAKVAANLYRYMNDAQSAVADKGAIMRNLLNSGLDSKQQAALILEAFKFEKGRNPDYTIQKFVEDLKVIPNAGKPEEPIFEFKGGAFVVSDKAGNVRASIPETDIKAAVASQQLRNLFDATQPGTDPKKADFNPALLPKADKIAEILRELTPAERTKAIADLKADLQTKGIRLDITNPNTTSPRVEMTYENPVTKQQVRDSAAISDASAPTIPTERDAIAFGDAMKQLLARDPKATPKDVEDLLKSWTDKLNTPGLDRNAFIARIKQQLGPNSNLEVVGTGADAKLVFKGKNAAGENIEATVPLGAPREVATATGPRTDVPALDTIKGAAGKEQLVQDIFKANNMNDMLKAIEIAKKAGLTSFQIGNDTYGLQVINVGKGTSLVHMTINGKIAVKAVDRNGTFTPQMDGKFFGSNHGNALINARAEQWKLRTPQEVSATLRAGVAPSDTTVGATVPTEVLPTTQQIQDYLKSKGIEGIDPAKATDVYKQVRDIEIALRTGNIDNKIRTMLQAIKGDASNPLNAHLARIIESTNQLTGTADGALKIDPSDLSIKIKLGDNLLPVKPEWSADTIRQLTALAGKDQLLARNLHKYLTDTSVANPDKAKALKELLTQIKDPTQAKTFLTEIFKAERNRTAGYRLNNFKADFAAAAPVGGSLDVVDNTIIYKTGAEVMASIPAAELNRELARTAIQGAFRDLLLTPPLPGMDPKNPDFNPQNLPKAEDIASWLKILSPQQLQEFKQTQLEPLRQALAAKNITLQLTDQNFVEIGYLKDGKATTRDGKPGLDRFKIGGDTAPVSTDQTALNMGGILADKVKAGATDAQLADYLKTIAGQLNAPGLDRVKFLAQLQTRLDPTGKIKLDLVTSGADAQIVLKRGEGKPDIPVALARREVAATTTGDTRPYAEQLKTLSDYLKLPNPPDKAVLDRMLANLALTHARSTNPPSFDNAKFIDSVKASLTDTGFSLFNDTSKTPPEVVLKKGDTVVSSPIKGEDVLRAAATPPDKANASIEDLAKARGIDVSKIPAEGTHQRKLFEAMLRGADGKTLTLLVKELYGKGVRSLELPDANGKMRKMELQVSGHYVHLYAADDSGRMRIAIRGLSDGRPQRGGYFGTRWTESMLGKSIIGTNKDATTPAPEVANPVLGATRPEGYKPNPEAMKAFTDLLTNTPAADRSKPDFQAKIAQAFSEAVRSELVTKGKDRAGEIEAGLIAALAGKGFTAKFDATTGKFALLKDGTSTAMTEVSVTNVPLNGAPETAEQRAARYLEPFGAMDRDQQKAYLAKIATEIGALGLERGKQVIDSMQTQLAKLATTDSRLAKTGLSFKNNEIVLEKYGASTRTGRQIESSDSIPIKFNTPVPPGDVRAFSTRLGEILKTTDGKTPTAALDAFKEFAQNIPQANRDAILRSALKTALTAHALLNPNVTADQLKSFNDVVQKFNPAYNVSLAADGSISIKGLSPQPDIIQKADLDKARLDYAIVKQMTTFNNELAALASRGVRDFSSFYGAFANANKDNPALVQAALKLALKEQFRLSPDLPLVETLSKYNSAMKNMPFRILYDPMIGTIHFQNQQEGQFKTVGSIKAKEYFTPAKLTEFVGKMSDRFIAELGKTTTPAGLTELVNSLQGFIIDNLNPQQASQLIADINAKQNAITIKGSRGKLVYARKAA